MNGTVSSVLLDIAKKHGIRHVFGLPAAQLGLIMDGASTDPYFTYVTTRHEEAVGNMAHAVHLTTGGMAMCFGTVGPGATNMLPGVAAAYNDGIPMLVLTGNNQLNRIAPDRDMLQHLDQVGIYRPVTKWNAQLMSADRTPELVEQAIRVAKSGRPGPVHLDIPCDLGTFPLQHDVNSIPLLPTPRPVPAPADIERIAAALRAAKRPLLIAGGGVARSDGMAEFRKLVSRTGFAVMTSAKGFGVADMDGPTHLGGAGWPGGEALMKACAEADLVLAIGCKFSNWIPVHKPPQQPIPPGQRIIQIDIEPTMLGKNAPVDEGYQGDARETIKLLLEALPEGSPYAADGDWLASLMKAKQDFFAKMDAIADAVYAAGSRLNAASVTREFVRHAPGDAIFVLDGGQISTWSMSYFRPKDARHVIWNAGMGHMGNGLPQAVGAKIANRDKPVILFTGDGAAGCTIQELETAARHHANLVAVIFNDCHWGAYRVLRDIVLKNEKLGTDTTDVDFSTVARGLGCDGERVDKLDELGPALKRALASDKPTVIDVAGETTMHPMDFNWGWITHGMQFPQR